MVGIQEVAVRAGVSVATVSRALRGLPNVAPETRARVVEAAAELHYVADPSAARLAGRRTATIGVVLPSLDAWYGGQLLAAMHHVVAVAGLDLTMMVVDTEDLLLRFVAELPFRKRVDGLIVVDVPFTEEQFVRIASTAVPVVTTTARTGSITSVGIDDRGAARLAMQHLLGLGHRDIALVDGQRWGELAFAAPLARTRGALEAAAEVGLDLSPDRILRTDWRSAGGVAAARALLGSGSVPTAVFAFSDEIALGMLGALREAGVAVPADISIVGFDDHDLAGPLGLTTVAQPVDHIGGGAAQRLLQRIADPDREVTHDVLPAPLVVRETTAAATGVAALTIPPDVSGVNDDSTGDR